MFSTKEPILLLFDSIETQDHLERVEFYEEHVNDIFSLDENKQFYCKFHYVASLFEIERFNDVLNEIDAVIEYVFYNQPNYNSVNPFEALIYLKSCALARVMRYPEAASLMEQLVGINPEKVIYHRALKKIYLDDLIFRSGKIRLSAMLLILLSAAIFAFLWIAKLEDVLRVNTTYFFAVLSPCMFAMILLLGSFGVNYFKSTRRLEKLIFDKIAQRSQRLP